MDDHAPAMVHEALVGLYPRITVSKATETQPLSQYLAAIRANTWQDQIESLRAIPPEDEKARQAIKKALAYITWTGTFTRRAKDALLLHSGVILGDIDKLTDFLTARALLEADPFTFFCFQSPSGNGLKVAMVCPPVTTDEDYKRYWTAAAEYHATRYGITWDPSGKDISRACFVSYDPAIYWNIEPLVMPEPELLHRLTPHLGALGDAEDGELHSTRNKTAYTVGGLVSAGTLPEQPCLDLLQAMAASKSSDPANARREIQRSFTDGMQKPLRGSNGRRRSQPYNGTAHDHGILNDELDPTEADPALAPFIPLPGKLQPKAELAATACQWLDDYITYSQRWSPRSAPLLHEAVAIWLLSVIAAGRVRIDLGPSHITTVMIAICAPSSVYAKSTTVNLGIRLLGATGLSALLHADESTPQALLKSMAKPPIPEEFFVLPEMERATITTRAAFAGQRSWFYEEWGQQLKQMQRSDGPMALLHGLLRRLDDGRLSHASDTIARGREEVNDPYLSLISNCTPTDLAPYCGPGHAYWHDGLWARFAFIGAGEATPSRARLPRRHRFQIPASLVKDVRGWHAYLGIPDVQIVNDDEEKKKAPLQRRVRRRDKPHAPSSHAVNHTTRPSRTQSTTPMMPMTMPWQPWASSYRMTGIAVTPATIPAPRALPPSCHPWTTTHGWAISKAPKSNGPSSSRTGTEPSPLSNVGAHRTTSSWPISIPWTTPRRPPRPSWSNGFSS